MVKTDANASDFIHSTVEAGWEPHFVVAMNNIVDEIRIFADMLQIEFISY